MPTPTLQTGEVLVQVKALSINPIDVKTRAGKGAYGKLKDFYPLILGWDIAGTIVATGGADMDFKIGDEVFGMVNFPGHGKAYAEYVAAPAAHLALKPNNVPFETAATATLAALTAYQSVALAGKVQAGQKVLIHAASGGVGHFAVQIAKHLGAYVIGTSSAANKKFVLGLGADEHVDHRSDALEKMAADVDFVLDTIGGENIDRSLKVIKPGGTLISIPSGMNDQVVEKSKAKGVNGQVFMVQSNGADMKTIATLLETGAIKPSIFKTYLFEEMPEAHLQQETGKTIGKLVIKI